jgi:CYTH domain-containing protein
MLIMAREIERKFLVTSDRWKQGVTGKRYRQGYLSTVPQRTVRVRVAGGEAWLTVKGLTEGVSRAEFEYPIPLADAQEMLDSLCERPLIEKTRYRVEHHRAVWEVDEFEGENKGLVIAEIELRDAGQQIALPDWVGAEVSDDPKYFNANLIARPFSRW